MATNKVLKPKEKKENVQMTKEQLASMLLFLRTDNSQRISNLESIIEFGHAFLIKWNQLELSLKLNYYDYCGIYPPKIRTVLDCEAKSMLNLNAKIKKSKSYSNIFGRKKVNSPLTIRNNSVHLSYIPSEKEYKIAIGQIDDIIEIIKIEGIDIQNVIFQNKKNTTKTTKSNKYTKL
jgi:hypothetical protein